MKIKNPFLLLLLSVLTLFTVNAEITNYPWPQKSELISNARYTIRARSYDDTNKTYGDWQDITTFLSTQRFYANHWKVGDDAGSDFMADRSLSFGSFAFTGTIEVEVTQNYSSLNAVSVELAPKAFGFVPNFFDGKKVRFMMDRPEYVSVNFSFGSADKTINRDDNRTGGTDIRHGLMIFTEVPESQYGYNIPKPTDPGVVVWSNDTPLSTIRAANIIYFPAGETELRTHPGRWEKNSSWDKADAAGNWVTTQAEYDNAPLYRGKLNLAKAGQKVYLAPGAIVYGGFHANGNANCWIYGTGIVTGHRHLMHEIVRPEASKPIAVDQPYNLITATKEAFCEFSDGAVYHGVTFLEAWHHTCPSGKNSTYKRTKLLGWCSNNDGIRPASGSLADRIFIKTSDDYDYARDQHDVKNAVFWPMTNGGLGQLGWNNLGTGYAKYYNMYVINSEWNETSLANKGNVGVINGGMADAGIKLTDDVFQDIVVENRTNILVGVKLSGTGTGYLKNFLVKNVTTEYPLSNPAGVIVKQDLSGISDTWVDSWKFTNVFIDGVLLTWDNYKNYFNLNLVGTNGANTDNTAKAKNITFNTEGTIYTVKWTKSGNGNIRPNGSGGSVSIASGMTQTIYIEPNDGNRIKTIAIDGELTYERGNQLLNKRTPTVQFKNISANHTVDVVFEPGVDYYNFSDIADNITTTAASGKQYTIYPNPVNNKLFIAEPLESKTLLTISNLQGAPLRTATVAETKQGIDTSQLSPGLYLLTIDRQGHKNTLKFVKN